MKQGFERLQQWDAQVSAQIAFTPAAAQQRDWAYWLTLVGAHLGDSWLWGVVALWEWEHAEANAAHASPAVTGPISSVDAPQPSPRPLLIRYWLLALFIAYVANMVLKQVVKRRRPVSAQWLYGRGPDGYSFPSGHAMRMGVIVTWAHTLWPRWGWLTWPLLLWVCWSRVRLGVHYVGDIVIGLGLGGLIGRSLRR